MEDESMKTEAIVKINKMGKAGRIITLIAKILCGIALAGTLLGTFSMACISDNILAKTNISEVQTYFSSEVREQIYQEVQSNEILRDYILNNNIFFYHF